MASVVEICNLALASLGAEAISSLDEASTQARACNLFYAPARDELLAGYPWGFAERMTALAQVANDRQGAWGYAYEMPVDCLKVRLVRPSYQSTMFVDDGAVSARAFPHQVSGGRIYSNVSQAVLVYTGAEEESQAYPPLFVRGFADSLAAQLAFTLTKSMELQGRMVQLAQRSVAAAQMADANQTRHFYDEGGGFLEARL